MSAEAPSDITGFEDGVASGCACCCCCDGVDGPALSLEDAKLASAAARPLALELPPPNRAAEDDVMAQLGTLPEGMVAGIVDECPCLA